MSYESLAKQPDGTTALDITAPDHGVEIKIRQDGKVVWINVDGILRLRICQIPKLELEDDRGCAHSLG